MGAPTTTTTSRDSRLDIARGLAIAGVVIVHVYRGLYSAGMVAENTSWMVDRLVGFWCLCVFVFVTGTFVPRGVQRSGVGNYIRDRVTRFFIVYVVWTLMQGGTQLLASDAVNNPMTLGSVLSLWRPIGHLWYLPYLILLTLVFVPLQPWKRGRGPWILAASVVGSIYFWGFDGGYIGTQGLSLVMFFVAGLVIGSDRVRAFLDRFSQAGAAALGIGVLLVATTVAVMTSATAPTIIWGGVRTFPTVAIGVAVAVVTSAAIFLIGHGLRSMSFVALLGRRSLEIYLAHIIMASGTRILLAQLGVTSVWVIAPCCFLVGIFGSLLAGTVLRRIGLGWVFDGPAWLTKRPAPSPREVPPGAERS